MFKINKFLLFLLLPVTLAYSQQDSALIEKIKNIDINLTSLDETDEDLYMVTVSFQSFYDELSPDGEWILITKEEIDKDLIDGEGQSLSGLMQDNDEGVFIWKPSKNSDADWHPYTNGKWIYTEQGWLWASNYKWGWAAYHYGRWWNSGKYGWVWLPGYVWAPAWVSWRVAENHIGWCPLSPKAKWKTGDGITSENYNYKNKDADWVFINKSDFDKEISKSNILDRKRNGEMIKNSKRIIELKRDNNKIVNRGPDVNDLQKHMGREIKKRNIDAQKEKNKPNITESDVKLYKESFKKIDKENKGRLKNIDKPKKFKKSPKIRRIIKKRIEGRKP